MKAIYTHYVGATNRKPARIIASDLDGNRATVPVDGVDVGTGEDYIDRTHRRAAVALCDKMGWRGGDTLVGGSLKHGMCWVFTVGGTRPAAETPPVPVPINAEHCGRCGIIYSAGREHVCAAAKRCGSCGGRLRPAERINGPAEAGECSCWTSGRMSDPPEGAKP